MNVIYITSDNRSGSTMLDMMLGGHSNITALGEIHHLRSYVLQDRSDYNPIHELVCLCGKEVSDCKYWTEIEMALGRSFDLLKLRPYYLVRDKQGSALDQNLRKFIRWVLQRLPGLYENRITYRILGDKVVATDSFDLYETVSRISGAPYVLDSSKDPFRLRELIYKGAKRIKVIILYRDYKGVIHSKTRRGMPLKKAAMQWKRHVQQMDLFSKHLNGNQVLRVRYEDLCTNTEKEMRRICGFLDLNFELAVLQRNREGLHQIGGSPSKFIGSEQSIKLDESYKEGLTAKEISFAYKLVRTEADALGYDKGK